MREREAGAAGRPADESILLACPVCGAAVRLTLRALVERRRIACPAGHEVELRDCAGLAQTIGFVGDLMRATDRRLPDPAEGGDAEETS